MLNKNLELIKNSKEITVWFNDCLSLNEPLVKGDYKKVEEFLKNNEHLKVAFCREKLGFAEIFVRI